jgi:predicted amidohydrolase YtcJ
LPLRPSGLILPLLILWTSCVSYCRAQQSARVAPADILIVHAKVYTVNGKKPWAQGVAIRKGKIVAVGSDEQLARFRGIGTRTIDAGGKVVLPAFTDSHVHLTQGGFRLTQVNLDGAKDVAEIQDRLRAYASKHPDEKWILGGGWSYAMFGEETLPNKRALDQLFPDTPVFLAAFDMHSFWANSKALALAGITKSTPNPPNGEIVHDPKTGEPTGALKEEAGELVNKVVPKPTEVETLNALRAALKWANQNGLARVDSAGWDFEQLNQFQELRDDKQLSLRLQIAYLATPPELRPLDLEALEDAHKKFHDEWIDVHTVKFFLDGVIESHTAALLEPYADDPSTKGSLFWDPGKYKDAVAELDKREFQIYTHAVGDYAVRTALDAYELAEQHNHTKDRHPRIEHIETIAPADIPRFGKLGVIESHTAALLEPYADDPSTKGSLFWDPGKYKDAVAELDKRDFQIYSHAVGDYAVRTALDAYEVAAQHNHTKDRHHRIEHIETIAPADIPRFGKLGVIASMQPLHAYPDEDTLGVWAGNIGPERASRAWLWKDIAQRGGRYTFGSDWPIVTLNPWEGIQTAVTRQTSDGKPANGFVPSQRLTVAQAVEGYTIDAAYAGHLEKTEGSLETGKVADVIMIDRNIFEVDPHTIDQTKVVLTIVGGKIVYEADTP